MEPEKVQASAVREKRPRKKRITDSLLRGGKSRERVGDAGPAPGSGGRRPRQNNGDRTRERATKNHGRRLKPRPAARALKSGAPASGARRPSRAAAKRGKGRREEGKPIALGQGPAGLGGPGSSSPPAPTAQEKSRIIVPARSIFTGPRPRHRLPTAHPPQSAPGWGGASSAPHSALSPAALEDCFRPRTSCSPQHLRPRRALLRSGPSATTSSRRLAPAPATLPAGAGPQGTPRPCQPPRLPRKAPGLAACCRSGTGGELSASNQGRP